MPVSALHLGESEDLQLAEAPALQLVTDLSLQALRALGSQVCSLKDRMPPFSAHRAMHSLSETLPG